ncbi:hypothetical protein GCM10009715_40250 [Paeniglutamicibacter psychrophenolicus]
MVHGDLIGPAQHDVFADSLPVPGTDAALVGALGLVDRVLDLFPGILPVMPGGTRYARQFKRLPLGAGELRQGADEVVLGV